MFYVRYSLYIPKNKKDNIAGVYVNVLDDETISGFGALTQYGQDWMYNISQYVLLKEVNQAIGAE